ncbi:hypothetical protein M892_03555 [Vibrio campbellii ATCC BAA-1116]|nr:hypothetical protein M892_03555 [Vibrio campbellii ATCC BAA-1116]
MRNAQLHIIDEKCHVSGGYLSLIFRCLFDDLCSYKALRDICFFELLALSIKRRGIEFIKLTKNTSIRDSALIESNATYSELRFRHKNGSRLGAVLMFMCLSFIM